MTLFEKNMDVQQGFDFGNSAGTYIPETIDLSYITPDMMEADSGYELEYHNDAMVFTLVSGHGTIRIPDTRVSILAIYIMRNMEIRLECEYRKKDIFGTYKYPILKSANYNIILPKWMAYKAKSWFMGGGAV